MASRVRFCLLLTLGLVLAACGEERQGMVSTANEHASAAAAEMLQAGGSAADGKHKRTTFHSCLPGVEVLARLDVEEWSSVLSGCEARLLSRRAA